MIKFTKNSYVDIEKYEARLKSVPYIVLDVPRMSSIRKYNLNVQTTLYKLTQACIAANSGNRYASLSKDNMYRYLVEYEGVPDRRIGSTPNGDISMDVNKYLKPLYEDGYAQEFLSLYLEYVGIKKSNSDIGSIISDCYIPIDDDHPDLRQCTFNVAQRDNLRFFYNNVNVVNIPKIYNDCIVAPPGYVLVAGDFAQSDFRIAYNLLLRDETNSEIMDNEEDKYTGMAKILAKAFNEDFDEDKFKAERKIFKTNALGPLYGKERARSKASQETVDRMNAFLKLCPRYQKFKKSLISRIELGLPVSVDSYFGNSISVPIKGGKNGAIDTLNKALNAPIQTGTSEIMILLVNSILDKFASLGYTEGEDFSIYYSRHDEPLFIIKEDLMKDSWIFKNASDILVDNWTPLRIDFSFHRKYTVECPELDALYKKSIIANRDKIEICEPSTGEFDYHAVKDTIVLGVYNDKVGDKSILCIYDENNNRALYRLYDNTNEFVVAENANNEVLKLCTDLYRRNANGALVRNPYFDKDIFYGGIMFKFTKLETTNAYGVAKILCENMCARYAKRNDLSYTPSRPLQDFANLIRSVKDWDEV